MKLLKAFLICFITSAAFAAGGTHVIQEASTPAIPIG